MRNVAPYPFGELARHEPSDVIGLRVLSRLQAPELPVAVAEVSKALLGADLSLQAAGAPERASTQQLDALLDARVTVTLELQRGALFELVLVALPIELCAVLVDRVLGGDGGDDVTCSPAEPLDPISLGVIGYLAARLSAATSGLLRVRAIDDAAHARLEPPLHAARGSRHEDPLVWPLTPSFDGRPTATLHVVLSARAAAELAGARASLPELAARVPDLAALPLSVCAHGGEVVLLASELASLGLGDVVFPERQALSACTGGYEGVIALHVSGSSRRPLACCALRIDTLTLTSVADPIPSEAMTEGHKHDDPQAPASTLEALADAPIELCIELARFSLRLDELLALRPGELLSTGKPVGSEVTLSAAGRPVARGELIAIDGELGVRITALLKTGP